MDLKRQAVGERLSRGEDFPNDETTRLALTTEDSNFSADLRQLCQVLKNLTSNALDAAFPIARTRKLLDKRSQPLSW